MSQISVKELLEAGAHFGHQASRWNPKMRPYIFATKGDIHILDLDQTVAAIKKAVEFVGSVVAQGQSVLFVGTKNQAAPIVRQEAERCGQYYVTNRWLGGLLTNFKTIKASIDRLHKLEELTRTPDFEKYTKMERLEVEREIKKLNWIFAGIKTMTRHPGCLFIVDPKTEDIAKREARRLKIPIVAIVDTNCDPKEIDYLIPANDDAIRSIQVITKVVADACEEGAKRRQTILAQEEKEERAEEEKPTAALVTEREMKEKGKAYVGRGKKGEEETTEEEKG
ncbi:MAG: 30S ribosomal protein S2 [Deltaproteobacteria bacterium]|nr:30S ribosomal protein S2 [Deltaproteobacteria bacterium]